MPDRFMLEAIKQSCRD